MKYYDFVCRGWCHIRVRLARLVSNAFLYTTTVACNAAAWSRSALTFVSSTSFQIVLYNLSFSHLANFNLSSVTQIQAKASYSCCTKLLE